MLLKLNLQRFAPQLGDVTINFDTHIKKVVATSSNWTTSYTWTTSGETLPGDMSLGAAYGQLVTFDVTLDDGYVIDTVTLGETSSGATIKSKTDTQFVIENGSGIFGSPITITSKQSSTYSIEAGSYEWNAEFDVELLRDTGIGTQSLIFKSNNEDFTAMKVDDENAILYYVKANGTNVLVSSVDDGFNESYRTITLDTTQNVSETFYNNAFFFMQPLSAKVSIDLTSLSGWGNVTSGSHNIQVVAKADGYRDSEKSTVVSFTKTPPLVTIPAGTYHFSNEYLTSFDGSSATDFTYKSNNVNYTKMYRGVDTSNAKAIGFNYYPNDNGMVGYIYNKGWGNYTFEDGAWKNVTINNAIQTIVVETDQHVPQEFYDWFMINTLSGTVKETWLLNSTINFPASGYNDTGNLKYNIKFVAKNRNFVGIAFWKYVISSTKTLTNMYYEDKDENNTAGNVTVYTNDKKWYNQGIGDVYRTIQLYEIPTGDLLTWLKSNGVKQ